MSWRENEAPAWLAAIVILGSLGGLVALALTAVPPQ